MWGFNGTQCVPFSYKGCGGNLNRFFTKTDCEELCEPTTSSTTRESNETKAINTYSEE